jgi:uncharacterized protein (UPF0264 family)
LKLLISPKNKTEAIEAIKGGADIIDIKNPSEGPLGANFPWIIKEILKLVPKNVETSCTIGEMPKLPGSISLAARGAASTGVNYIKAGLSGLKKPEEAINLMTNVVKAVKNYNSEIKVVITGYADAEKIGSINPLLIPIIAANVSADVSMIDTALKNGKSIFDFLDTDQIRNFVETSHKLKLKTALAGSIKIDDLKKIPLLEADIVGIRGAACTNNDRLYGKITRKKVQEIVNSLKGI